MKDDIALIPRELITNKNINSNEFRICLAIISEKTVDIKGLANAFGIKEDSIKSIVEKLSNLKLITI